VSFVIGRTLEHGTMKSVAAVVRRYGRARIVEFLRGDDGWRISARTRALWLVFLGLDEKECTPRSSPRSSAPFWTP
jgi:hypothetical protein